MADPAYSHAAERFAAARRSLMLPFPNGEAAGIVGAFTECRLGLRELPRHELEDPAAGWLRTLDALMNTEGINDPMGSGAFKLKALRLTNAEKSDLSRVVDELAQWFRRRASES
jgi:hypothetical protein